MLGDHVVPLLILGIGSGSWSHHDGGRRRLRPVHIINRLVSTLLSSVLWSALIDKKGILPASSRGP